VSTSKRQAAAEIVGRFATLAFRRPVAPSELERLLALYDLAEKQGDSFESSVKLPLQAALVSPHFLFRIERGSESRDERGARRLTGHELASRLSYFLWSTMPDAELFEVAERLHDPALFEKQVRRMLKDPRARSLAENFAIQWLQLRRLETQAPDPKRFPTWDEKLRAAMHEEAVLLFDEIVRGDKSLVELLGADYTYLNERLAAHYGIAGVTGPEMRRVALQDPRRGGVLTLGAVLTVTSNPTRTAAVKRGKWVLETILGTPPPPPLPDAGELKDETAEDRKLSLRHGWRSTGPIPAAPTATSGWTRSGSRSRTTTPSARGATRTAPTRSRRRRRCPTAARSRVRSSSGADAVPEGRLRPLPHRKNGDLCAGAGRRVLRRLDDQGIRKALAENEYRISTLVTEIAKSYPFQYRRDGQGKRRGEG
jgi:hypothetical protein